MSDETTPYQYTGAAPVYVPSIDRSVQPGDVVIFPSDVGLTPDWTKVTTAPIGTPVSDIDVLDPAVGPWPAPAVVADGTVPSDSTQTADATVTDAQPAPAEAATETPDATTDTTDTTDQEHTA